MRRFFLAALFCAVSFPGWAQNLTIVQSVCPLTGCTFTGAVTFNSTVNAANTTGYQLSGNTGIQLGTAGGSVAPGNPQNAASMALGAGGSLNMATAVWAMGIGPFALANFTASASETAMVGTWSGRNLVSSVVAVTGFGVGTLVTADSATSMTAGGTDSMRSLPGGLQNDAAWGDGTLKFGAPTTSVAVGSQAVTGNSSNITLGGNVTLGDVLTLNWTSTVINGGVTISIPYTVQAGDTTLTILAASIATTINNNATAKDTTYRSTAAISATSSGPVVQINFIGTQATGPETPTISVALSGGATETATVADGVNGANLVGIGFNALHCLNCSTATRDIAVGSNSLPALTTGSDDLAMGNQSGLVLTTGLRDMFFGTNSGEAATTANDSTCFGYQSCLAITTGVQNSGFGSGALGGTAAGGGNTAGGYQALGSSSFTGGTNTAVGNTAGQATTSANNGSLFGAGAGARLTSGSSNNAFGLNTLKGASSSTAARNSAFGDSALAAVTSASDNSVFGRNSGAAITTATFNLFLGAGIGPTTFVAGSDNIVLSTGHAAVDLANNTANTFGVYGNNTSAFLSATGTNTPTTAIIAVSGGFQIGSTTPATLAGGEFDLVKIGASGSAPGAGNLKLAAVAGTNSGSCKIIAYAGTSTTPVTLVDNVGGAC